MENTIVSQYQGIYNKILALSRPNIALKTTERSWSTSLLTFYGLVEN